MTDKEAHLEFVTLSEPRLFFALLMGLISSLFAFVMLFEVVQMRIGLIFRERRTRFFKTEAINWLVLVIAHENPPPLKINANNLSLFLYQWIYFHEILRDAESKYQLNQAIHRLGLEKKIYRLLHKGRFEEQLIAVTVLGHFDDMQAWDDLVAFTNKPSALLSLTAAHALVVLNPAKACDVVMPLIIQHRDWMPARLSRILQQSESVFQKAFLAYLEQETRKPELPPYLTRLMHIVDSMALCEPLILVAHLLLTHDDPDLIAATLRLVRHPSELRWVRLQFSNSDWRVQLQIVLILGKMGSPQDAHYLVSLLNSPEWWVRYRAAQALAVLPCTNRKALRRLMASRSDRFARDILQHILIEQKRHR